MEVWLNRGHKFTSYNLIMKQFSTSIPDAPMGPGKPVMTTAVDHPDFGLLVVAVVPAETTVYAAPVAVISFVGWQTKTDVIPAMDVAGGIIVPWKFGSGMRGVFSVNGEANPRWLSVVGMENPVVTDGTIVGMPTLAGNLAMAAVFTGDKLPQCFD